MVYIKKNKINRYWFGDSPEEYKFNYLKESCRDRCIDRISLPCIKTAIKYGFTKDDLQPIIDRYLEIIENGKVPESTIQKRYYKQNDEISVISETDTGYSSDSFF